MRPKPVPGELLICLENDGSRIIQKLDFAHNKRQSNICGFTSFRSPFDERKVVSILKTQMKALMRNGKKEETDGRNDPRPR